MANKPIRTAITITLITIGSILLLSVLAIIFILPGIAKNKLVAYVEDHTENHLIIESISFTGLNSIEISSVDFKPKLGTKDFNKKNGFQSDWIHFKSKHVQVHGIKWYTLFSDKKVFAENIQLEQPDIYVYRDKRVDDAPYKYKPLPSHIIRNAGFPVTVPLLEIKKGTITYEEHPKDKDSSGILTFNDLYASAYNISTDSVFILEHPVLIVDGKGSILDSAKAEIKYTSNVLNKDDKFTFEATVHSFSAVHLNQCLSPLSGAAIESGDIKKVTLFFEANDDVANGTMEMEYENLKLTVLSKSDGKESKVKSFIANIFIKDKTKESGTQENIKEDKTGVIHFERRKDRFIFNYWWNAIKTGVVSIVTPFESLSQKKVK